MMIIQAPEKIIKKIELKIFYKILTNQKNHRIENYTLPYFAFYKSHIFEYSIFCPVFSKGFQDLLYFPVEGTFLANLHENYAQYDAKQNFNTHDKCTY